MFFEERLSCQKGKSQDVVEKMSYLFPGRSMLEGKWIDSVYQNRTQLKDDCEQN